MLGEFQTLVNPDETIPAFITVLTGITDAMVIDKPRIAEVLPSFLEFAHGSVLVAHNAPFDVGFLKHNARELGIPWPRFEVLDTAVLARRVLLRDEVPNVKLSRWPTSSRHHHPEPPGAVRRPRHRRRPARPVRATRPARRHASEEVASYTSRVTPAQRKKRTSPTTSRQSPASICSAGRTTTSSTSARPRNCGPAFGLLHRVGDPVPDGRDGRLGAAGRIVVCATALEAQVREVRLIARHRPPYNRRSKFPHQKSWLKLTREPWPRLSVVRSILDDDADYIGPFRGRVAAEEAMVALHDVFPIRQCTGRLPAIRAGRPAPSLRSAIASPPATVRPTASSTTRSSLMSSAP